MLSVVLLIIFLLGCQGGPALRWDEGCTYTIGSDGNSCTRSCPPPEGDASSGTAVLYNCDNPKHTCQRMMDGECGFQVCSCEDNEGVSQLGTGNRFMISDQYNCTCSEVSDDWHQHCGARCNKLYEMEEILPPTEPPPAPPPRPPRPPQ